MLALAMTATACSKAPTAPGSGSVTINGAVVGGAGSASATAAMMSGPSAAVPGLVVSVVGTEISTPVGIANQFVLREVPSGNIHLQFTAPGLSALLGLQSVREGETVTLSVALTDSSTAEVQSERRSGGSLEQLEGRVEAFPTTPVGSLVVAGRRVTTDENTRFFMNGAPATFADLAIGQRVHVKGQTSGGSLLASQIHIQNTNAGIPVNLNGIVSGLVVNGDEFEFMIDGRLVRGDELTTFFGGSVFADLIDGVRAEVKGQQGDGFVYAVRIHVNVDDENEEENDESASIEAELTDITGTVPQLTLTVGTTTVLTNAATEVQRRGDVQDLDALQEGMTVHVVGIRQSNGSLLARMIQIKGDAVGGIFEIEGALGGRAGTCPAITFSVNGYVIVADATTTFVQACSSFSNGNRVRVEGVVQANGSVLATSVEKK
jgi:hypothetical protein